MLKTLGFGNDEDLHQLTLTNTKKKKKKKLDDVLKEFISNRN